MAPTRDSGQKIVSRAPTRIDLAGGTVDLWPLFLFLREPSTLNLGIDLFAQVELEADLERALGGSANPGERGPSTTVIQPGSPSKAPGVVLTSKDLNHSESYTWDQIGSDSVAANQIHPALVLPYRLLQYFVGVNGKNRWVRQSPFREQSLRLTTSAKSPAGAGLGGSSTLAVALVGALSTWARGRTPDVDSEGEDLIEICRDVETTIIHVPAGLQDYYGAMFGGLQTLRWKVGRHQRAHLDSQLLPELDRRILLFYSGQSRNSGINNWALFKSFLDRDTAIKTAFQEICDVTVRLEHALRNQRWTEVAQAIATEWLTRHRLAAGISTPEIDRAFADAKIHGALAGKGCGAGGGGCFFVLVDPATREQVGPRIIEAFEKQGIKHLPFKSVASGLSVVPSAVKEVSAS